MKATELLKTDHAMMMDLIRQCGDAMNTDPDRCREVFERIQDELELHAEMEETLFYPAVANAGIPELGDEVQEAMDDHMIIKELLGEITEAMQTDAEQFNTKFMLLTENVTRHVKEEEDVIFTKLESVMSPEKLEELGDQLEGMKGPAIEEDLAAYPDENAARDI